MNTKLFLKKLKYKLSFGKKRHKYEKEYKNLRSYIKDNNRIILVKADGTEVLNPQIDGLLVCFEGKNSVVRLHEPCSFSGCEMHLGDDNTVIIKDSAHTILNLVIPYKMEKHSKLFIGKALSCVGCKIYMHDEPNTTITIGDDCMFSFDVVIWPSDGHVIIDEKGRGINPHDDIKIGNHCWIGMGATILKGSNIPNNSIVGAKAVFTKKSSSKNIVCEGFVFAGIPAKPVKTGNFTWERTNCYYYNINEGFLSDEKNN